MLMLVQRDTFYYYYENSLDLMDCLQKGPPVVPKPLFESYILTSLTEDTNDSNINGSYCYLNPCPMPVSKGFS